MALLGVAAAVAGLGLAWITQRRVVADIGHAVDAANEVAEGRFDRVHASGQNDEVGQLLNALARMAHQLSQSINTVKQAAQSIGTASVEIASGNQGFEPAYGKHGFQSAGNSVVHGAVDLYGSPYSRCRAFGR